MAFVPNLPILSRQSGRRPHLSNQLTCVARRGPTNWGIESRRQCRVTMVSPNHPDEFTLDNSQAALNPNDKIDITAFDTADTVFYEGIAGIDGVAGLDGGGDSGIGDRGGKDDNSGDEGPSGDGQRSDILAQFGKSERDMPSDLRGLSGSSLAAYLKNTRGGFLAWLSRVWPGWRVRLAADPEFGFKVLMEETVGLGLAASGMIAARGKDILSELDFAFCDIAVGATMNFILVYLLAPAFGARSQGLGKLPANLFVVGNHSLASRIGGFLYKGALFSGCGFAGSLVGTTLSQGLIAIRRTVKTLTGKSSTVDKELPSVLVNSAAWAGFMFISSNPRYQALAGIERALFSIAPPTVAKFGSGVLRTGNNIFGGAIWVWWSTAIGLQKKSQKNADTDIWKEG